MQKKCICHIYELKRCGLSYCCSANGKRLVLVKSQKWSLNDREIMPEIKPVKVRPFFHLHFTNPISSRANNPQTPLLPFQHWSMTMSYRPQSLIKAVSYLFFITHCKSFFFWDGMAMESMHVSEIMVIEIFFYFFVAIVLGMHVLWPNNINILHIPDLVLCLSVL